MILHIVLVYIIYWRVHGVPVGLPLTRPYQLVVRYPGDRRTRCSCIDARPPAVCGINQTDISACGRSHAFDPGDNACGMPRLFRGAMHDWTNSDQYNIYAFLSRFGVAQLCTAR